MKHLRRFLDVLTTVSSSNPEDMLRRRTLAIILSALFVSGLVAGLLTWALAPTGLAGTPGDVTVLYLTIGVCLVGCALLYWANRRRSGRTPSLAFLLLLVVLITASDAPAQIVQGRSLVFYALPILAASVLLGPSYSMIMAALCGAIILVVGWAIEPPLVNIMGVVAFMLLAGMSWLWSWRWLRSERERLSAQQALIESEGRYRGLVEHQAEGISIVDLEERFLFANPAAHDTMGVPQGTLVGRSTSEFFTPASFALSKTHTERRRLGETSTYEVQISRPNGELCDLLVTATPVYDAQGNLQGSQAVFRDITERKRAEVVLATMNRGLLVLTEAAVGLTAGKVGQELYADIVHKLKELTGSASVSLGLYDAADTYVHVVQEETDSELAEAFTRALGGRRLGEVSFPISDTTYLELARQPILYRHSFGEAPFEVVPEAMWASAKLLGIDRFLMIAYFVNNELYGVSLVALPATVPDPRPELVRSFTNMVAVALRRIQAEEALRDSEERYRTLVEHQGEGVDVVDLEERYIFANPAAHTIFGVPQGKMVGRSAVDFFSPDDFEQAKAYTKRRALGETNTYEMQIIRPDGEKRDLLITGSPVFGSDGRLVGTQSVFRDITERKRAEQRAERLLNQQLAVNRLALDLGETLDLERIYQTMYAHVSALIDADGFILSFYNAEERLIHAGYVVNLGQVVEVAAFPPVPLNPVGQGPQSRVIITGESYYVPDLDQIRSNIVTEYTIQANGSVTQGPPSPEHHAEATHAALLVPMKVEGRVIGVLQVQSRRVDAYSPDDVALLSGIANVAAVAVQNAMLYEAINDELAERQRAEQERERLLARLEEQTQQLEQVMYTVPEGVLMLDGSGTILLANPTAQQHLALLSPEGVQKASSLGGRPIQELLEPPSEGLWHTLQANDHSFEVASRPLAVADGSLRWVMVLRDTTEQQELQRRVRQQDRMAIIGQLAGGVAHDFNNLLTTILGYTDLVVEELPVGSPQRADLGEVRHAAERAAGLTSQLLAFSRQQVVQPRVVSLNNVISNMERMLQRLIGEQVTLRVVLAPRLAQTLVDPGQFEQVVMNLVVNARDAMPEGGTLTLETHNTVLDEKYARDFPEVLPGRYVLLAVSDTGTGMSSDVLAHMFEPFYTTKGVGKGTGLGLATVLGIIKQARGHVTVYSELGVGTTFRVYLPMSDQMVASEEPEVALAPVHSRGGEVILLVEDEEGVRRLARRALEEQGYEVLEAPLPSEALRLSATCPGPIHLLLTDVIMPEMSGPTLAEQLRGQRPGLAVLYMSGYTDDAIAHHGVLGQNVAFLSKPFSAAEMTSRVRIEIDQHPLPDADRT